MYTLCFGLQVAKLALNCLWGKLGQRDNQKQVKYFKEQAELVDLLASTGKEFKKLDCIGDRMVRVEYVNSAEFIREQANVNVVLAAYTTAYGRLRLYDCLDQLGDRLLYFDTGTCVARLAICLSYKYIYIRLITSFCFFCFR